MAEVQHLSPLNRLKDAATSESVERCHPLRGPAGAPALRPQTYFPHWTIRMMMVMSRA